MFFGTIPSSSAFMRVSKTNTSWSNAGAMERKLALISETAGTLIELVHNQRSLRLEWYIIGLIGLELLLSLYGLVSGGLPFATGIAR